MPEETVTASGVTRIAEAFADARTEGRAALMPYLMGGFPDPDGSKAVARTYADGGADLIELGIPFSDPLADGPVIHAAATAALQAGTTLESALEVCAEVSDRTPVVAMAYANMILATGSQDFAEKLASAGAAGAIVPDLPLEEARPVREALLARGLAYVPLVAPTTPPERRRAICAIADGFVYVVSTVGVTGERSELPPELTELIASVREEPEVPAAVGFGIGTPEQAATIGALADGVIIGTRLVRIVAEAPEIVSATDEVARFLQQIRSALAASS
ncbi:MAG TPA: tryptophan synthase subunit alpha [Solirubrobacterales bacterium]|jgi:tryptophan synthase alpha chain|nr:tryptophan synthase subunit alpha [Solirubrobacterales bacterium]